MSEPHPDRAIIERIRQQAQPLATDQSRWNAVLERISDARIVLLGEASHGSHEFYEARAEITRRLVEEKGFVAVVAEADWPDAYRVNRYVQHQGHDETASEALIDFKRFPTWMWRNDDVRSFVSWLRDFNRSLDPKERCGFYGMDLYSLGSSIAAVLEYLDRVDPEAARRARERYACFDHSRENAEHHYGRNTAFGISESCEREVIQQLKEMQRLAAERLVHDGLLERDEAFFAEQNARVVQNAEEYYRQMYRGRVDTWNLRDRHMVETLDALASHISANDGPAKVVVWAHNSHLGDARATEMGWRGQLNVGQLCRQLWPGEVLSLGFTTHTGTVACASDWDRPMETKRVRPSLANSYERLMHETEIPAFLLDLHKDELLTEVLSERRLERAIGVIYMPRTERMSHYFEAELPAQFDLLVHFDETRAVQPLDDPRQQPHADEPETFPSGL